MSHSPRLQTEQIQLISLKPKHCGTPPPKRVVSNRKDSLTPDIVWSEPVPRCFLYSLGGVGLFFCILIVHRFIHPYYAQHPQHAKVSLDVEEPSHTTTSTSTSPHIFWFILDDLGQADISYGSHGAEFSTPAIDALAGDGIELWQHYVSPLCSATRSALLTGAYAYKMGLQGVQMDYVHPSTVSHIPSKYTTVAQYMKSAGYGTKMYGKWHVGYAKESYTPTKRGFDSHIGQYQYAIDPFSKHNLDAWQTARDWFVDGEFADDGEGRYASDILLDAILEDIDAYTASATETTQPMFMYIAFTNPHFPVLTPKDFDDLHGDRCSAITNPERQKYCLSVSFLDVAIGRIVDKLKDTNLYDNALIALTGDNGPQALNLCGDPGRHVAAGSAFPYRGGKYTLFQGGVQTPAFISGGAVPKELRGTRSAQIVHATDWMPTLLGFAGFEGEMSDLVDGENLWDEIVSEIGGSAMSMGKGRRYLVLSMEFDEERGEFMNTAVIYKKHKLLVNNKLTFFPTKDSPIGASCNVRSADPQNLATRETFASVVIDDGQSVPDLMLFDIDADPYEETDLLGGEGSSGLEGGDDEEVKDLVDAMMAILEHEKKRVQKNGDLKTQYFEAFYADEAGYFVEPLDLHIVDGVHAPWQSEEEEEFPEGYNY